MTQKIKDIIDKQINEELYSAYLYLAFAARLEKWGFKGQPIGWQCRRRKKMIMPWGSFASY